MKSTLPNILGKEFDCINKIIKGMPSAGIGDDCAVLGFGDKYLLLTVDTFSNKVHFDTAYFSLGEIGEHCAEASISDIAAVGGEPSFMLLSVATTDNKEISNIMKGIKKSLLRHKMLLIGGDTTYSRTLSISMTILGTTKTPRYRSDAKIGDSVYITGPTGLSAAGFFALRNNIKGFQKLKRKHKLPLAQIKKGLLAVKHANAMIDISDGLASELYHIAYQSNVSIELDKVPIDHELKQLCTKKGLLQDDLIFYGGEDYELIITGKEKELSKIKGIIKIGKVIKGNCKIHFKGKLLEPAKCFKHF